MINVKIIKGLNIEEIEIKGHAGYKEYGKDIVCASVSTAIIMTVNLIEKFNQKLTCKVDEGYFYVKVDVNTLEIKNIIENLVYTITDLRDQFPKYINIGGN